MPTNIKKDCYFIVKHSIIPTSEGEVSECGKVFGSNPKRFELLKTYLAMFLRTSSLKRLNSFGAAENIPCSVQKNTTPKFKFVACKWRDCHSIGKQYGSLSSLWAIRLYSPHVCLPYSRQVSKPTGLCQIQNCCFFEGGILPSIKRNG